MMDLQGPLWGLTPAQDRSSLMRGLLIIMRVPGLLLMDIWWSNHARGTIPPTPDLRGIAESGYNSIPFIFSMIILLLPLQELVNFYMHVIAAATLVRSVFSAWSFPQEELKVLEELKPGEINFGPGYIMRHAQNAGTLITCTWIIRWCLDSKHPVFREVCPQLYLIPLIASFFGLPYEVVEYLTGVVHGFTAMFCTLYTVRTVTNSYIYYFAMLKQFEKFREEVGVMTGLYTIIKNTFEPPCLVLYFLVQLSAQVWSDVLELEEKKFIISDSDWLVKCLVSLSEVCCSPLLLISFSLFIMTTSNIVLTKTRELLHHYTHSAGAAPDLAPGATEGVITFILGLQTGLTDLEMPGRIGAVSIVIFVVVASILQSCLEFTHPVLLSMPALNRNIKTHLLPVSLTLFLMLTPCWMVYTLLTIISSELWTLVIVSSCLVTALQSLGHLLEYLIILWDCRQPAPPPSTDDLIFWMKAGINTGELAMAVVVVGGGFYESFIEDDQDNWSVMNTMVLTCHCYINIYSRVRSGWKAFLARRETSRRLSSMRKATSEELSVHGDVCSICYQEMTESDTVVITDCQHFFHQQCLKKWLMVQDNCPLCTKPIVDVVQDDIGNEEDLAEETDHEDEQNKLIDKNENESRNDLKAEPANVN